MTARYATEAAGRTVYWSEVPADSPAPLIKFGLHETQETTFVFRVPQSATVFSVVLRTLLEAEKQRHDATEFDLNCC